MIFRTNRQNLRALLVATTALSLAPFAAAQDTDASEEELREEAVTVYGTSNPLPVFDYPGQVTVVDREALDTLAPSTISDALRDVPGLDFVGGPRRTGELPTLRGLTGQNVLILLDGARQSFTSAHDGRFFVDPELIGTAEVVRGPASALYGSGAVGGVLAFESVDADDLLADDEVWGARARLGYQSVNEETSASLTAYTRQGAFDGIASFGIRQSGDIELGSGADLPSDDDIQTALLKGSYAITDALTLEGSWQRFTNTAIEPNNGQGVAGTGDGVLDRDVEKDITTDTFRLGVTFDPEANDWVDLGFNLYQTSSDVDEFDATIPRTTVRDIETTGFNIRNASRFAVGAADMTLTIGGDWFKDEQVGTDDQTTNGTRGGVPNGESEFTGVFAQLEAVVETPAGQFIVIPGVRYDEFESSSSIAPDQDNSDDAVSPRFAASFAPEGAEWLRLFGSYSEGFRAPSINELYLDGVHFLIPHPVLFNPAMGSFEFAPNNFIPNPDLVPEETQTLEFGAGIDFRKIFTESDRLQAKISYFETEADELINLSVNAVPDATCFAPPFFQPCTFGTSESSNVDQAEIEGWEGELHYDSDRFFARASFSTIEGTDLSDGSDLGSLTPDRIALNLGVKVPEWNSRFGARVQHASDFEQRISDGAGGFTLQDERDGYVVLDLYTTYRPEFVEGLRLDVGVDNVFDEEYERVFAGVPQPGTNLKITASWQFGQ
ncbi:MAG: TonB-dependent hemoglobin/transferrin/lactoferrin family receptor [Henriciella sp.]|nr:TonB-dependent hemoglobin/transferrin/lactoferrin family receptor [Henriciella sp.]